MKKKPTCVTKTTKLPNKVLPPFTVEYKNLTIAATRSGVEIKQGPDYLLVSWDGYSEFLRHVTNAGYDRYRVND